MMNRTIRFFLLALLFVTLTSMPVFAEDGSVPEAVAETVDAAEEAAAQAAAQAEAAAKNAAQEAAATASRAAEEAAAAAARLQDEAEAAKKAAAEEAARLAEEAEKAAAAAAESSSNKLLGMKTKVTELVEKAVSESKALLDKVKSTSPATAKKVAAGVLGAWGISLGIGYMAKGGTEAAPTPTKARFTKK